MWFHSYEFSSLVRFIERKQSGGCLRFGKGTGLILHNTRRVLEKDGSDCAMINMSMCLRSQNGVPKHGNVWPVYLT